MRDDEHEQKPATNTPTAKHSDTTACTQAPTTESPISTTIIEFPRTTSRFQDKNEVRQRLVRKAIELAAESGPQMLTLRSPPWSDSVDFLLALRACVHGMTRNGRRPSFVGIYYDNGRPTRARGIVFSETPEEDVKSEWQETMGALPSGAKFEPIVEADLPAAFSRIILRALAPTKLPGPTVVATGSLGRIFDKAVRDLPSLLSTETVSSGRAPKSSSKVGRPCRECGVTIVGRGANAEYCLEHWDAAARKRSRTAKAKAQQVGKQPKPAAKRSSAKPGSRPSVADSELLDGSGPGSDGIDRHEITARPRSEGYTPLPAAPTKHKSSPRRRHRPKV